MTNTVLTDEQIFDCFDRQCVEVVISFDADDLYPVGRAIEHAVLESEQVQAWKRDAERYRWLMENADIGVGITDTYKEILSDQAVDELMETNR